MLPRAVVINHVTVYSFTGVFLLCWVPFFTLNIINAICIRYDLFDEFSVCRIDPILFSFLVWLGYMNSFLNPVIYTIFNMETNIQRVKERESD